MALDKKYKTPTPHGVVDVGPTEFAVLQAHQFLAKTGGTVDPGLRSTAAVTEAVAVARQACKCADYLFHHSPQAPRALQELRDLAKSIPWAWSMCSDRVHDVISKTGWGALGMWAAADVACSIARDMCLVAVMYSEDGK